MKNVRRKTLSALSLLMFLCAATAFAKPGQWMDVQLTAPDSLAPGANGTATLRVALEVASDSISYVARGEGIFAGFSEEKTLSGPWEAGREITITSPIRPGAGASGVITYELLGRSDSGSGKSVVQLFAARDDSRIWLSASSPIDLKLKRLAVLHSEGVIPTEELQPAVDAVVKGVVQIDGAERSVPLGISDLRLQNAAEAVVPGLKALRQSAMAPKSAVSITVKGHVDWTDSAGHVHGLPLATVEIRDADVIGSDLITTTATDAAGNYSSTFTFDDGVLQGDPDIFVRVFARSPVADIKPDVAGATTYFKESPVQNEVPTGSTINVNFTIGNAADEDTVFSVHHALVVIGSYAGKLAGVMPSQVDTRFPTTKSTSLFNGTQLHILRLDRWDWDVIHHEYGHYFMDIHKFESNPGGNHGFGDNLSSTRGSKDVGLRLAWGEGWPTFFGTAGQVALGTSALNIPNVGDTSYTDTEDSSNNVNLESSTGKGEDNEVSVMAALWDIADAANEGEDKVAYGDQLMFDTFKSAKPKTVGAAWEALAALQDTRGKTLLGATLGQSKIAPVETAPADNAEPAGIPTFTWVANGGGTPNPLNDFRVRFYKSDFSSLIFEKSVGNVTTYTPAAADWATIAAGDAIVKWVVEGKNTSAPASPGGALDYYWSGARAIGGIKIVFVIDDTGSMGEEIDGVKAALQSYIDLVGASLPAGSKPPTMQLITFKDNVSQRLTSNDLDAMRAAVGSLYASGGGDCPEFGAQALEVAAENIAAGGTILFATDASSQPGVDIGAVIAKLRAKGVSMNTVLSGDCSGISSSALADGRIAVPAPQKPGDEDLPHEPIDDPGQLPVDLAGDTADLAAVVPPGPTPVEGTVGLTGDLQDFFVFNLEAGTTYSINFRVDSGSVRQSLFTLLQPDGVSQIRSQYVYDSLPKRFSYKPSVSTNYFLRVSVSDAGTPVTYSISVTEDPYADLDSAVEMFSTISAQTGGAFLLRDNVNSGDPAAYIAAMRNVMAATLGPSVLAANPPTVQRGTTLAVTLRGRNTNWRPGSTVVFTGDGLTVNSVAVRSATVLDANISVSTNATLSFRDVTVTTALGSSSETAMGVSVLQVINQATGPEIISVEPDEVSQGDTATLLIRGINTAWTTNSTVSLDSAITVVSTTFLAPDLVRAQVTVAGDARVGFYTVRVATPDVSTTTKTRGLFVNSKSASLPQIVEVTPAEGGLGRQLTVTVTGLNTHFGDGDTVASFGAGIDVLDVQVISETQARVVISISSDAAPGFRDVSVTTLSETAVLLQGFFVGEGQPSSGYEARHALLQRVLAMRAEATGKDRAKLTEIAALLDRTLKPSLWKNGAELRPRAGLGVFVSDRNAVSRLTSLLKSNKSAVPKAALRDILQTLTALDRAAAMASLDAAEHLPSGRLHRAQSELAKAETALGREAYSSAISHYQAAWRHAGN